MQPQNKPLKRRKYDAIFKADVLKMIANGQRVAYVAGHRSGKPSVKRSSTNGSNAIKEKTNITFWVGSLTPYSKTTACYSASVN